LGLADRGFLREGIGCPLTERDLCFASAAEVLEEDVGGVGGFHHAGGGDVLERVADAAELDGVDAVVLVERFPDAGVAVGGDDGAVGVELYGAVLLVVVHRFRVEGADDRVAGVLELAVIGGAGNLDLVVAARAEESFLRRGDAEEDLGALWLRCCGFTAESHRGIASFFCFCGHRKGRAFPHIGALSRECGLLAV
jgi:hypothetical protein